MCCRYSTSIISALLFLLLVIVGDVFATEDRHRALQQQLLIEPANKDMYVDGSGEGATSAASSSLKGGDTVDYKDFTTPLAKVKFIHTGNGYEVSIHMKTDCKAVREPKKMKRYFNTSDIDLLNSNLIGPDEIIVQFEGASLQAAVAKLRDPTVCNEYQTLFQVPKTGSYRLKVARLRSNWDAVRGDDLYEDMPMRYELILDTLIDDNLKMYAPEPCSNNDVTGYWVSNSHYHVLKEEIKVTKRCSNKSQNRGVSLTTHIPISDYHMQEQCATDIENFAWNRKICLKSYLHSRDGSGEIVSLKNDNVTHTRPSQSKNKNWFLGRKILFVGDSHIQGLSDLFFNQVCQDKRVHEVKKELQIELDSNIQSVVDYYNVMYTKDDSDKYVKKLRYCRSMYDENKNFDDCVLFEELKEARRRRDLEMCIKANPGSCCCFCCFFFSSFSHVIIFLYQYFGVTLPYI